MNEHKPVLCAHAYADPTHKTRMFAYLTVIRQPDATAATFARPIFTQFARHFHSKSVARVERRRGSCGCRAAADGARPLRAWICAGISRSVLHGEDNVQQTGTRPDAVVRGKRRPIYAQIARVTPYATPRNRRAAE